MRSDAAYTGFAGNSVLAYTASRAYFAYWSISVLQQVRLVLTDGPGNFSYPVWAPHCAATLQVSLLVVNVTFLATHWRKLLKRGARKEKTDDQAEK
ncbi:unnamed protein product [Polarella glacialis]|uniref:TLC domain-containing protein n=1 Tax=Polarella glacialis TaxID=89957 RepID=A0A813FY15_POLGL|nr:unnamed protein product [Polarella glacialis]